MNGPRTSSLRKAKGREAIKIVLILSFWTYVALKVMVPLVHVLHLVYGKKATMGYIYEAMEKAKEAIKKSFNNN